MGFPVITLNHLSTGFTQVFYDDKYCGTLEDVKDCHSVSDVIKRIIHYSALDIEVKEVENAVTKMDKK